MKRLLLIILLLSPSIMFSQSQNPPSIKWRQINTRQFKIIYPSEIEDYAIETAYLMDSVYSADTRTIRGKSPAKVALCLQNRTVDANAYATLTPRKMVWNLTPPASPNLSLSPWRKTLGIHEFRHITQYNIMNKNFTMVGRVLFGRYGQTFLQNWSVPNWFFEGDAVYYETKLSNSGRGRMPDFSLAQRAIYLNDKKFSFEKAFFRSYKDYYPSHYQLGYHLVANVNKNFGEDTWNKVLYRTTFFSFWPYTLERSLKKRTGSNLRQTYKKTYNELDSIWQSQIDKVELTDCKKISTKKKRARTNYLSPKVVSEDTLLVVKNGFDYNNALYYLFTDGREQKIRDIRSTNISYANHKVVWDRTSTHIRYGEISYSDIVVFDLKTKKLRQITSKGKYFSPILSSDGKKIVVVAHSPQQQTSIVVLDLDGNVLSKYDLNEDYFAMQPTWSVDDKSIIYLETSEQGEALRKLDLDNNMVTTLIEPSWIKFANPYCFDKYVFFNYDYSGITNLYALNIETKQIFAVTSRKFSADYMSVSDNNKKIYFTDYDLKGYNIAEMDYKPDDWKRIEEIDKDVFMYFESDKTTRGIENVEIDYEKIDKSKYNSEHYTEVPNLLNIHSWSPIYDNKLLGFDIYSDNILNTMTMKYSLRTNSNRNIYLAKVNLKYSKYFPVFNLGFTTGQNGIVFDKDQKIDSVGNWYENNGDFSVSIPLNFSKGTSVRVLNPKFGVSAVSLSDFKGDFYNNFKIDNTQLATFNGSVTYVSQKLANYRDLQPRFGHRLLLGYKIAPDIFDLSGEQLYGGATIYLPGILKHHGIKFNLGYEEKIKTSANAYNFSSILSMPRGYEQVYFETMSKASVQYSLPLLYPDLNIPYILFVKRIRTNIFYDFAQISRADKYKNYSSAGFELIFDFNLLRINYLTLSAGLQGSYLFESEKWKFQGMFLNSVISF